MSSFDGFLMAAERQQVGLNQAVMNAGQTGNVTSSRETWHPTHMMAAAEVAGRILRLDPRQALAENQLDLEDLPQDSLSQSLGRIVNASLVPLRDRTAAGNANFRSNILGVLDVCSSADLLFADAVKAARIFARTGEPSKNSLSGVRIVLDGANRAVFFQKANGVDTALLLRGTIDGIPYPPGSIVRLDLDGYPDLVPDYGVHLVPSTAVESATFQRFSIFTAPPEERRQEYWRHYQQEWGDVYQVMSGTLKWLRMSEITRVAESAAARVHEHVAAVAIPQPV